MKKLLFVVFAVFLLSLYGYRSLPSEAVGISMKTCSSNNSNIYYVVSIPFTGRYIYASELDSAGVRFRSISKWNPLSQDWYTASYDSLLGWSNDFEIETGRAYVIQDIQQPFEFITHGEYTIAEKYALVVPVTQKYDHNINLIMHPLEKYIWKLAGSDLGNDIYTCSEVTRIDTDSGIKRTTYFNGQSWENDFEIKIGDPLFVDISEQSFWPDTGLPVLNLPKPFATEKLFNIPKAFYWRVIKDNNKGDYDINSKEETLTFSAWITGREDDIITDKTYGCGFMQINDSLSTVYLNTGNFINEWQESDEVNIVVTEQISKDKKDWKIGKGSYRIKMDTQAVYRGFESIMKDSGEPIVIGIPDSTDEILPVKTALYQNYPNPFNPETTIGYSLKNDCDVKLTVYNYKGQVANELVNGRKERGHHTVTFNADMLSSGVYFYTLEADGKKLIRKMVMVR